MTLCAQFLHCFQVEKRIVLTGTPLQNDLREFFALVGVVNPNIFGSLSSFVNLRQ